MQNDTFLRIVLSRQYTTFHSFLKVGERENKELLIHL